jgi:hypothetical protein
MVKAAAFATMLIALGCGGTGEEYAAHTLDGLGGDTDCPACIGASGVVSYLPGTGVTDPYNSPLHLIGSVDRQYTSLGNGASSLIVKFLEPQRDQTGIDLVIWGHTDRGEAYQVAVSSNGTSWTTLGTFENLAYIDLRNYRITFGVGFVRIRNASSVGGSAPAAGPDFDAVLKYRVSSNPGGT